MTSLRLWYRRHNSTRVRGYICTVHSYTRTLQNKTNRDKKKITHRTAEVSLFNFYIITWVGGKKKKKSGGSNTKKKIADMHLATTVQRRVSTFPHRRHQNAYRFYVCMGDSPHPPTHPLTHSPTHLPTYPHTHAGTTTHKEPSLQHGAGVRGISFADGTRMSRSLASKQRRSIP